MLFNNKVYNMPSDLLVTANNELIVYLNSNSTTEIDNSSISFNQISYPIATSKLNAAILNIINYIGTLPSGYEQVFINNESYSDIGGIDNNISCLKDFIIAKTGDQGISIAAILGQLVLGISVLGREEKGVI